MIVTVPPAHAQTPGDAYILAPATRTVVPAGLLRSYPSNYDFVRVGDQASEAAHQLQESSPSVVDNKTLVGRSTGATDGDWIAYTLKVAPNQPFAIRIDDVSRAPAGPYVYSVSVNNQVVHTRTYTSHNGWTGVHGGCQAYSFEVPAALSKTGSVVVKITKVSGNPAKIAAIWTLGVAPLPDPARGGTVEGIRTLPTGSATLTSNSATAAAPYVVFDFGRPVCGPFKFDYTSTGEVSVKLTFSNSKAYAGLAGDALSGSAPSEDASHNFTLKGSGTYTKPFPSRGWVYTYVTVMVSGPGALTLSKVQNHYEACPQMAAPNAYRGYFYCNDEELNKLWYAGAYTAQTCTEKYVLDGGKRDRALWGGDLFAAGPTVYLSYAANSACGEGYKKFFDRMDKTTGYLNHYSPMYHLLSVQGMGDYIMYTGDVATLKDYWDKYKLAVKYITDKLDNGLFNAGGGNFCYSNEPEKSTEHSSAAFAVLQQAASFADYLGDKPLAATYAQLASSIKMAINAQLWDAAKGAYRQAPTKQQYVTAIGTSLPILYGIADAQQTASTIKYLQTKMRNPIGFFTVDDPSGRTVPKTLSPYANGYVARALCASGHVKEALAHLKSQWSLQLTSVIGNGGTYWEDMALDGESRYDAYDSFGHCWATAPTPVLTEYVLGVTPVKLGYSEYKVLPMPGGLTEVQGGVPLPNNKTLVVAYTTDNRQEFELVVNSASHTGSSGTFGIPHFGSSQPIYVNSQLVWDGAFHPVAGISGAHRDAGYVYLTGAQPGVYVMTLGKRPSSYHRLVPQATNGTLTVSPPSGVYRQGSTVTLTAKADRKFGFSGWSGDLKGMTNPVTVKMTRDMSVIANFSPGGEDCNLAVDGTATQSSLGHPKGEASRAIDGNTDSRFFNDSVTHTGSDAQAWWQVDLGADYVISSVRCFNRTDADPQRATDYDIKIGPDGANWPISKHQSETMGNPTVVPVKGVTGRYVRIQLRSQNILTLAEVEVWGRPITPGDQ